VAVVNESLARELGGSAAAVGQRLKLSWRSDGEIEIVASSATSGSRRSKRRRARPVYLPHGQDRQQLHDADAAHERLAVGPRPGPARGDRRHRPPRCRSAARSRSSRW
jgi:hypothetical protein